MAFHKSLCTLLAAATLSYSTPAWGNTPVPSCEERVEGAVLIEKTDYCADRFGAIYGAAGDKLQNPKTLLKIQRSAGYKEAKEGANALYLQREAVRQRETSSGLEEQVKKEKLRKKEETPPPYLQSPSEPAAASNPPADLPPPYLQPGYQEPSSLPPSSSSPSWQPRAAESSSSKNKENDIAGYLLTGGGLVGIIYGLVAQPKCNQRSVAEEEIECSDDVKSKQETVNMFVIGGSIVVAGIGIYLLLD